MKDESLEGVSPELEENVADAEGTPTEGTCGEAGLVEEELVCLDEKVAELELKAAEYLDGWQRSQAAFANFRKRTESERNNSRMISNAALLARLVPVIDDFERAFQSLPEELNDNPWLEGVQLIQRKIHTILETENVELIKIEVGDAFDPLFHQAVLYQEVDGFEDGQIVAVVEKGYILGERVLRPSMVVVAKGPVKPIEIEPGADEVIVDAVDSPPAADVDSVSVEAEASADAEELDNETSEDASSAEA